MNRHKITNEEAVEVVDKFVEYVLNGGPNQKYNWKVVRPEGDNFPGIRLAVGPDNYMRAYDIFVENEEGDRAITISISCAYKLGEAYQSFTWKNGGCK